jgi:hypothetical protein
MNQTSCRGRQTDSEENNKTCLQLVGSACLALEVGVRILVELLPVKRQRVALEPARQHRERHDDTKKSATRSRSLDGLGLDRKVPDQRSKVHGATHPQDPSAKNTINVPTTLLRPKTATHHRTKGEKEAEH